MDLKAECWLGQWGWQVGGQKAGGDLGSGGGWYGHRGWWGSGGGVVMEVGAPSGVVVMLGSFGSGIKLDVMEGKPILYGRRSWKWLLVASMEM